MASEILSLNLAPNVEHVKLHVEFSMKRSSPHALWQPVRWTLCKAVHSGKFWALIGCQRVLIPGEALLWSDFCRGRGLFMWGALTEWLAAWFAQASSACWTQWMGDCEVLTVWFTPHTYSWTRVENSGPIGWVQLSSEISDVKPSHLHSLR